VLTFNISRLSRSALLCPAGRKIKPVESHAKQNAASFSIHSLDFMVYAIAKVSQGEEKKANKSAFQLLMAQRH
jgi:hypothetical protein